MPLNEINPEKACKICGAEYDADNNRFIVRCGKPINAYDYSGRVCFFAKKREDFSNCLNPLNNENPPWDSMQGLDPKSEKVLRDIGVKEDNINYLKQNGKLRY